MLLFYNVCNLQILKCRLRERCNVFNTDSYTRSTNKVMVYLNTGKVLFKKCTVRLNITTLARSFFGRY